MGIAFSPSFVVSLNAVPRLVFKDDFQSVLQGLSTPMHVCEPHSMDYESSVQFPQVNIRIGHSDWSKSSSYINNSPH